MTLLLRLPGAQGATKNMRRIFLIVVALLVVASPAFAQDNLAEWTHMLKQDLRATKKEIVAKGMITFTDEEAKRFWPIYDAYNAELGNFVDARVALIKAYSDEYENMTDQKTTELLTRRLSIEKHKEPHWTRTFVPSSPQRSLHAGWFASIRLSTSLMCLSNYKPPLRFRR
jgi:hypothetical protein